MGDRNSLMKSVVQKTTCMLELDVVTTITSYIIDMHNMMNTHFSNMALGQQPNQVNWAQQPPCGANPDTVNFVGNTKRVECQQNYGNWYNPSWIND